MMSTKWIVLVCAFSTFTLSQCKARKDLNSGLSGEDRLYNANLNTGVVQELLQGMQFAGNAHVAISHDGSVLATVGSTLTETSNSENDLSRQDFVFNYENNNSGQGGLTAIYLWDAKTLQPINQAVKKLDGYNITGIRDIAFTTDGKGLAVCGEGGLAFWPDISSTRGSKFWSAVELKGACHSIAFGRLLETGGYGVELTSYDVLAIGTSLGVHRYLQTKEQPSLELICAFDKPVFALEFLGSVRSQSGSAPDGNNLLVTVGQSAERSRMNLLDNRTRSTTGSYAILPFVTMPSIGRVPARSGLNLGNINRGSVTSSANTSCNGSLMSFDQILANPSAIAVNGNQVMVGGSTDRYVQIFNHSGKSLTNVSGPRGRLIASAEAMGGVRTIAVSGTYGIFDQPIYFTGSADRTARLWQYDIDGKKSLDVLSQINLGNNNYVSSGVFLKHRPAVVFGDRGGVFVWDFEKALQPRTLKLNDNSGQYTAIGMDDKNSHVYLGTNRGDLVIANYRTNEIVNKVANVLAGESSIRGVEFAADLKTALVFGQTKARIIFAGQNPELAEELNMWEAQRPVVGYKFGTDQLSVFSVDQLGEIKVKNSSNEQNIAHKAQLNGNERVVDFSVYPMNIKYNRIVEKSIETDQQTRAQEIHPIIAPIVAPNFRPLEERRFQFIDDPFQIFGENKRAAIEKLTGEEQGSSPKPSSENPDLTAGSRQTPAQANDQLQGDGKACANGLCENPQLLEQQRQIEQMQTMLNFRPSIEKADVQHLKVALLLNSGRILMVDIANKTQWELQYRKSPVLGFSGFFQQIYRPQRGMASASGSYQLSDDENGYLATSLAFDDDGGCLMISIRNGDHLRCLPVLQSTGTNAPPITVLASKPARDFFDPWIVYNGGDRKLGKFSFAQYYTMAVAADSNGGLTSFDLNHFTMPPYSKRMHRLKYLRAATGGKRVTHFATSVAGDYAIAIHEDNRIRLHWIDRAFELSLLDISNEDLDALRDFAQ